MKEFINKRVRFRISFIFFFFLLAFSALFAKAYNLQIVQHDELNKIAQNQRTKSVPLTPKRGFVYDRGGEMLAVSIEVDSIYANPHDIENVEITAEKLSKILQINKKTIAKKLKSKASFVWLKRKSSFNEAAQIAEENLSGIKTVKESKRYYPNFSLASHVLGFSGMDSEGLEGIELKYDYYIKGDEEYLLSEKDALGKTLSIKEPSAKWGDGCDLYLTIDKNIQDITETELRRAVQEYDAKSGIAIVQEPSTGKILAMASFPDFNPNTFTKSSIDSKRNRATHDVFDPGSTFKPFVVAAALEEGVASADDIFYCENGLYTVDGVKINDTKKHSWLSIKNIIKLSSNIGAIKIAEKLGKEKLYNYITKFGFGVRTNIDLPGESSGMLRSYKKWTRVDFSTASFGQGISSTAIQLVNAFSVIANGGKLMRPFVVEKIVMKDKSIVKEFAPEIKRFVISTETARQVTDYLASVVEKDGTGYNAAMENYTVAGKTGTAQKVDHELKQYSKENFIGSFIGFAPVQNPVVTVGVFIDEPKENKYGGVVAAPVFKNIVSQILNLRGVAINAKVVEKAKQGNKTKPAKSENKSFSREEIDVVALMDEKVAMPNLIGKSLRQIIDSFSNVDLNLKINGSGRVVEQFPLPGEIISKGKAVIVRCASNF